MNEQSAVVAGQISQSETRSASGIPGIGHIPGAALVVNSNSKQKDVNELLVVITPHIISSADQQSSEIWMPATK